MIIVSNLIFLVLCAFFFNRLQKFSHPYAGHMAWFVLLLGVSSIFGATAHVVHYQLGMPFFRIIFFIMSALSMVSMYFCFRAAYSYYMLGRKPLKKYIYPVTIYAFFALLLCVMSGSFLLLEINGGMALLYALFVHYRAYRQNAEKGSRLIITGIGISMLSMVVHLAKVSLHEWFNQKDLAHVIMIIALLFIGKGAEQNSRQLQATAAKV